MKYNDEVTQKLREEFNRVSFKLKMTTPETQEDIVSIYPPSKKGNIHKRNNELFSTRNVDEFRRQISVEQESTEIKEVHGNNHSNIRILDIEIYNIVKLNNIDIINGFDLIRAGLIHKIDVTIEGIEIPITINAELLDYSSLKPFTRDSLHGPVYNDVRDLEFRPFGRGIKSKILTIPSYDLVYFIKDIIRMSIASRQAKHEKRLNRLMDSIEIIYNGRFNDPVMNNKLTTFLLKVHPSGPTYAEIIVDLLKSSKNAKVNKAEDRKAIKNPHALLIQKINFVVNTINTVTGSQHARTERVGGGVYSEITTVLANKFGKEIVFTALVVLFIIGVILLIYKIYTKLKMKHTVSIKEHKKIEIVSCKL